MTFILLGFPFYLSCQTFRVHSVQRFLPFAFRFLEFLFLTIGLLSVFVVIPFILCSGTDRIAECFVPRFCLDFAVR